MAELSLWDALRVIAERTSFRTEEEGRDVLACIDKHADEDARQQALAEAAEERERADAGEDQDHNDDRTPAGDARDEDAVRADALNGADDTAKPANAKNGAPIKKATAARPSRGR